MLQACLYADRHAMDYGISSTGAETARRGSATSLLMSTLVSFGRTVLRARVADPLSDHLLQDIGLTRAEFDALSL